MQIRKNARGGTSCSPPRALTLFRQGSTDKKRDSLKLSLLVREAGLEAVLCQLLLLRSTGKDGCSLPFWRPLGDLYPKNCICKLCYFLRSSAPPSGFSSHDFLFLLSTKPAEDLLQLHNIMIDCYTNKLWNFVIIGRILLQHLSILGIILAN